MSCNSQIHDELKNMGESTCPFCDQLLVEVGKVVELCCSEKDVEKINGINVCINCGSVYGYDYLNEYIDFYDNMYMIRRKSVYHRKYHIENVMNSMLSDNDIQLTYSQRDWIYKVFNEIGRVHHEVSNGRKRMISIKFIINKLFKMLGLPYNGIQVTKSKRILEYYEQYWAKVQFLIGNRI